MFQGRGQRGAAWDVVFSGRRIATEDPGESSCASRGPSLNHFVLGVMHVGCTVTVTVTVTVYVL